ncbi:MAG: class I SAM-dependent methyltransferase [Candidatus Aenigmatarchaeota archaeon]
MIKGFKDAIMNICFELFEKLGIHILPISFYSPIPILKELKRINFEAFDLHGVNINDEIMLKLLEDFKRFSDEFNSLPFESEEGFYLNNPNFGPVDSEVYYCIIRLFKPKRIIEIGSGFSTMLALDAIRKNEEEGFQCELIAIDPYPSKKIRKVKDKNFKLIQKKVENMPISYFNILNEKDILFIDSSHVVRVCGDVCYLYLRVLPRLKKGVLIHSHDIFLPFDYPKEWVIKKKRFWSEQYLLHAFLLFNKAFEIIWASNYIKSKYPEKLKIFRSYKESIVPGSFWIIKTA